jgi:hypothetical protein
MSPCGAKGDVNEAFDSAVLDVVAPRRLRAIEAHADTSRPIHGPQSQSQAAGVAIALGHAQGALGVDGDRPAGRAPLSRRLASRQARTH